MRRNQLEKCWIKTPLQTHLDALQVAYNFSLPYESTVQKDGLVYPVHYWRDAEKGLSRMDTFGGRNILISTKARTYPYPFQIGHIAAPNIVSCMRVSSYCASPLKDTCSAGKGG